ncbi:MAG: glucose-6-phosphate dehydrogenase [Acidimicrobiia bacterium]|nr:glucose-6-phosphate dehydrogenase [Acidimicrobiia bacterium]
MDKHLFVIIGGTGDLARRKLIPSLYDMLAEGGHLGSCVVLGVGPTELTDAGYREMTREALSAAGFSDDDVAQWCDDCIHYQQIGREPATYAALAERITEIENEHDLPGNRTFYLALPPSVFTTALEGLGSNGLSTSDGWARVVIEKPFGTDLASAHELNEAVHRWFDESQVYRIDHYLGKQTVQNLLVFRFANALFAQAWDRENIDNVQITVAESLGVEGRGGYYDAAGALRDMVQNHLTQLLTLVAMEPPVAFEADAIRTEKVKVLKAVKPIDSTDVVYGQYDGYTDEPDVPPTSTTPTSVALRLSIDNWRWQGVPFYLRTGKSLRARTTQIVVTFREPPVWLFGGPEEHIAPNVLVLTLQPDEGFDLHFEVKSPAEDDGLQTQALRFRYADEYGDIPMAYETLIQDVVEGDQTLFVRSDEVEESWKLYQPLLDKTVEPHLYEPGTWGPDANDELPARDGNHWWAP